MSMEDLSVQQLMFVTEYMKCGNATKAAIKAGYSEKTATSQGSRLLTNANIQAHLKAQRDNIDRDLRATFVDTAVDAYGVLKEIMMKPDARDNDRITAAKDMLDRAGYKPVDKIAADVKSDTTLNVKFNIPRPESDNNG